MASEAAKILARVVADLYRSKKAMTIQEVAEALDKCLVQEGGKGPTGDFAGLSAEHLPKSYAPLYRITPGDKE